MLFETKANSSPDTVSEAAEGTKGLEHEFKAKHAKKIPTVEQLREDPENVKLSTAPFDPRFPNTNQTKNCWQNYVDYHLCLAAKGEDYEPCGYFKRVYKIICPQNWVSRWDDLRSEGRFAADLTPPAVDELEQNSRHH